MVHVETKYIFDRWVTSEEMLNAHHSRVVVNCSLFVWMGLIIIWGKSGPSDIIDDFKWTPHEVRAYQIIIKKCV